MKILIAGVCGFAGGIDERNPFRWILGVLAVICFVRLPSRHTLPFAPKQHSRGNLNARREPAR